MEKERADKIMKAALALNKMRKIRELNVKLKKSRLKKMKSKLGNLNSGLDPEMVQAGITLAGYHIEKGARTFSVYSTAMVNDLGDTVKPYLKSWYMAVKYYPNVNFQGMDDASAVENFNVDIINEANKVERTPRDPNTDSSDSSDAIKGSDSIDIKPFQRYASFHY